MKVNGYILLYHKNTTWIGKIISVDDNIIYRAITEGFDQTVGCNYGVNSDWIMASSKKNNFKETYPELFI